MKDKELRERVDRLETRVNSLSVKDSGAGKSEVSVVPIVFTAKCETCGYDTPNISHLTGDEWSRYPWLSCTTGAVKRTPIPIRTCLVCGVTTNKEF